MGISGQKASLPHLSVVLRVMLLNKAIPFLFWFLVLLSSVFSMHNCQVLGKHSSALFSAKRGSEVASCGGGF